MSSERSNCTLASGKRRRVVSTASPATSSSISSRFFKGTEASWIRVMDSRFSTMVVRASASFLMSLSRETSFSLRGSSLDSSTAAAPEMAVRGVRRSWETERRILLRMVSRAASS